MNFFTKVSVVFLTFIGIGFSQTIKNVTFMDITGKSYDLHALLDQGKYVCCHFMYNA